MADKKRKKRPGPGRPSSEVEKKTASYNLPARLVEMVNGEAYHTRMSRSDVVAMALIEFFAGRPARKQPDSPSIAEIAKRMGVKL
ncbi:MAG: hypothetical protein ABII79_05920 [bacterium]